MIMKLGVLSWVNYWLLCFQGAAWADKSIGVDGSFDKVNAKITYIQAVMIVKTSYDVIMWLFRLRNGTAVGKRAFFQKSTSATSLEMLLVISKKSGGKPNGLRRSFVCNNCDGGGLWRQKSFPRVIFVAVLWIICTNIWIIYKSS